MNSLQSIGKESVQLQFIEERPVDRLSSELFVHIFSYLRAKDIQPVSRVSRRWNREALFFASLQVNKISQEVIKALSVNQKTYSRETGSHLNVIDNSNVSELFNLNQFKEVSSLEFARKILNILGNRQKEDLPDNLQKEGFETLKMFCAKEENPFVFLEETLGLLKIYSRIFEASKLTESKQKDSTLKEICEDLIEVCSFDKAIEIAETISEEKIRDPLLNMLGHRLLDSYLVSDIDM